MVTNEAMLECEKRILLKCIKKGKVGNMLWQNYLTGSTTEGENNKDKNDEGKTKDKNYW